MWQWVADSASDLLQVGTAASDAASLILGACFGRITGGLSYVASVAPVSYPPRLPARANAEVVPHMV
ncbi:hypothetical protein OJAV_G00050470 [Oryzias javanicus]|uniref:Uncharacterized protein n=1 Tax=Oryzias javanicus TaxID=123683 RepID=A0A3S2Q637_ORYJA|nr:hypothetical protein OJAV_G00050470 [Oryzias javanicus]